MKVLIPTFKFHGSKARMAKYLFRDIDFEVNNYFEPFAGRGNSFFYFASNFMYNKAFLNDLYLSHFLIALRDYDGDYLFVPDWIDRNIFNRFKALDDCYEKNLAESFCCYNGLLWGKGANITNNPEHLSKNIHSKKHTIERMQRAKEILQRVEITKKDYHNFLDRDFSKNDLIYCDPPYINTSKKSGVGPEINHEKLAQILKNVNCKIILSGYQNQSYDSTLKDFSKCSVSRASCGRNSGGGSFVAQEQIWKNF